MALGNLEAAGRPPCGPDNCAGQREAANNEDRGCAFSPWPSIAALSVARRGHRLSLLTAPRLRPRSPCSRRSCGIDLSAQPQRATRSTGPRGSGAPWVIDPALKLGPPNSMAAARKGPALAAAAPLPVSLIVGLRGGRGAGWPTARAAWWRLGGLRDRLAGQAAALGGVRPQRRLEARPGPQTSNLQL